MVAVLVVTAIAGDLINHYYFLCGSQSKKTDPETRQFAGDIGDIND